MILAPAFSQSCLAAADSSQTPTSSKSLEARITPSLPGAWEYVAPRKPIRILRFVPAGSPAMRNPDGLAPTAAAQQTAEPKNFRRLNGCGFMRVRAPGLPEGGFVADVGRVPSPGALRNCHNETSPTFLTRIAP